MAVKEMEETGMVMERKEEMEGEELGKEEEIGKEKEMEEVDTANTSSSLHLPHHHLPHHH